jgi:hypothetical protein
MGLVNTRSLLIGCAVMLLASFTASAQLSRGTITGTVTDSAGAVIPGATVTIRNLETNAAYKTGTTGVGQYTMPNLPVGVYEVSFEVDGFKKLTQNQVNVSATEVVRVDAVLQVGSVAESIEVTAQVQRLQTDSPEVATSLSDTQLNDLPLSFGNARIAEDFAYKISPGVSGDSYNSHVNGSTSFSKEALLDGASVSTFRAGDFGQMATSIEALQEFKVQTSGMSAEYGRTQGGVFNFIMKSGTNRIHGSAYGALRNEALNANTFVNNARNLPRGLDRKQNFAGSFGGPVYIPKVYDGRDKTFFYVTYERYRQRVGGFRGADRTVPLPEFYEGDFSRLLGVATGQKDALGRDVYRGAIYDPLTFRQVAGGRWIGEQFTGNRIPVSRFSSVSRTLNEIAKAHYLPTVRDASGQIPLVNNAVFPASSTPRFDQHQFSIKGDQMISAAHKLSGSYSYNTRPRILLDQGGMWDIEDPLGGVLSKAREQPLHSNLARAAHDWTVSPTLLNHAVVSLNRLANPNNSVHADVDGGALLGLKNFSTIGVPLINWGGGPFVSLQTPGDPQYSLLATTAWGVQDSLSWSRGKHFVKTGADVRATHVNSRGGPGGVFNFQASATAIPNESFSGNLTGYSFASYLLGIVNSGSLSQPVGLGGRRNYYALFVQDDFKISRRLSINIGLRWEYQPPATEAADRMANFSFTKIDPASGLRGAYEWAGNCSECNGQRYFGRKDKNDFGPRFGFAWQPRTGWVVRGAYGIMYEGDAFNGLFGVVPAGLGGAYGGTYNLASHPTEPWRGIFNWDDGFPTNRYTPPMMNPSFANVNSPNAVDPNYGSSPYVQAWNLNIQRELPWNVVVDAGYIGRKGTGLREGRLAMANQVPAWALEKYGSDLNNPVRNAADAATYGIAYPYPGFNGTVASALREFPQVRGNATIGVYGSPLGFSSYHSFQVVANRQTRRGLTIYANYTWSKNMTNIESSDPGGNGGRPLDTFNLKLEKSISDYDIPHMFKGYFDYALPIGSGKALLANAPRLVNTIVGGWSVSAILNYYSGTPMGFGGSFPLVTGWNGATNRANIAPGQLKADGFDPANFELSTLASPANTYLDKSKFSDPAPLTLGTAAFRYTQVRSFGTINEDVGLQKKHQLAEGVKFTLRAELLNVLNRHKISAINTSVTSPLFGQATNVTGNRSIQVGMRLDF